MATRSSALFAVLFVLTSASTVARAYCLTHTDDEPRSCPEPAECADDGVPLAWRKSHISYGFNERGAPGLSDDKLRDTIAAAFKTWQDVQCDGVPLGFHMKQLGGTTELEEGPRKQEPNENVVTHYDADTWVTLMDHSKYAFALTAVYFYDTGEIRSADLSLNGGMDLFGDCAVDQCLLSGPVRTDLQNVVTHELGHFFGLSHSQSRDRP